MIAKEKAKELFDEFRQMKPSSCYTGIDDLMAKECALIAVKKEYHSLREQLFNFRATGIIENEKVYLTRLDNLIKQEEEIKQEIENL